MPSWETANEKFNFNATMDLDIDTLPLGKFTLLQVHLGIQMRMWGPRQAIGYR